MFQVIKSDFEFQTKGTIEKLRSMTADDWKYIRNERMGINI